MYSAYKKVFTMKYHQQSTKSTKCKNKRHCGHPHSENWFYINSYFMTMSQIHRWGFESCTSCTFLPETGLQKLSFWLHNSIMNCLIQRESCKCVHKRNDLLTPHFMFSSFSYLTCPVRLALSFPENTQTLEVKNTITIVSHVIVVLFLI